MTPEEMRIAITKACPEVFRYNETRRRVEWIDTDEETDPLADLNAMNEAEKTLKGEKDDEHSELASYYEQLCLVCGDGMEPLNVYEIDLVCATAAQRAEAFCRTLWPERFIYDA